MTADVRRYVSSCARCNQSKNATRIDTYVQKSFAVFPSGLSYGTVHIYFLGPLTRTDRGNEHVLIGVDQFTKRVECIPLSCQSAEVTARPLVNDLFF